MQKERKKIFKHLLEILHFFLKMEFVFKRFILLHRLLKTFFDLNKIKLLRAKAYN